MLNLGYCICCTLVSSTCFIVVEGGVLGFACACGFQEGIESACHKVTNVFSIFARNRSGIPHQSYCCLIGQGLSFF